MERAETRQPRDTTAESSSSPLKGPVSTCTQKLTPPMKLCAFGTSTGWMYSPGRAAKWRSRRISSSMEVVWCCITESLARTRHVTCRADGTRGRCHLRHCNRSAPFGGAERRQRKRRGRVKAGRVIRLHCPSPGLPCGNPRHPWDAQAWARKSSRRVDRLGIRLIVHAQLNASPLRQRKRLKRPKSPLAENGLDAADHVRILPRIARRDTNQNGRKRRAVEPSTIRAADPAAARVTRRRFTAGRTVPRRARVGSADLRVDSAPWRDVPRRHGTFCAAR